MSNAVSDTAVDCHPIAELHGCIGGVDFSTDGSLLVSASDDTMARVWINHFPPLHHRSLWPQGLLCFRRVLCTGQFPRGDSKLQSDSPFVECRLQSSVAVLQGHTGRVCGVSFLLNGKLVATASSDHIARLWEVSSHDKAILRGHDAIVGRVQFSADGTHLVTASAHSVRRLVGLRGFPSSARELRIPDILFSRWMDCRDCQKQ